MGLSSFPFLSLRASLSTLHASFKPNSLDSFLFDFLLLTFAYRSGSTNCLCHPYLDWHTKWSTHDKVTPWSSIKKIIRITYPTTPRSMPLHKSCFAAYGSKHNANSREGQTLVEGRSREKTRIRNPSNLTGTNKIWEGLLNSFLIASKAIGSKDSSLGVWHHKLRAPPWPVRKSLGP